MCFIIISEIRWVNSSIYIFFKAFWHGIMVLIKNLLFNKGCFHMTDTYVIDVQDPGNALDALMFVLAIDAEKCSRN